MSLGTAGCGYEFDNPDYKCAHLSGNLFGFECLKYRVDLSYHERSKHPLRCKECIEDASEYWESELAKIKKEETMRVRQSLNAL